VNVWAIVPVKPLNRAKSRLANVLSPELREFLAMQMLRHTVTVLSESAAVSGILVISRDNRALVIAREYGARTVQESGAPALNPALERASQLIASWNAQAALVLPADLPLLMPEDIRQVVQLGRFQQSVVVVPDRNQNGTNALLTRPPGMFRYEFGDHSFDAHVRAAEAVKATLHVFRSERLMLDVDTPEDLMIYLNSCRKSGVEPLIDVNTQDLLPFITVPQKENP
jgi:2-phospho-L-lactate guanylyltransferase